MSVKSKPHIAAYHQTICIFFCNSYEETVVTECSCNSGVLGGAPRSSLPGEFQNLRQQ